MNPPRGQASDAARPARDLTALLSDRPGGVPFDALAASRIVVLDDDEDNVVLLERLLRRAGYRDVTGVVDAALALDDLAADPPDLLLLDLHMPGVDGFDVLDRLSRQITGPAPLPVIVLSADMAVGVRRRALSSGARDFLTKPYDLLEVLLRVGNLLETRYLHRRLHEHNVLLEVGDQKRLGELGRIAADLAHELRTPLYSIRGLVEVLLDFEGELFDPLRSDLTLIDDVAQEALAVVDKQIASARSAAGRTPLSSGPVGVDELLRGVERMIAPLARAQRIEFVVERGADVADLHTDGVLLAQILRNLLANAIRHTYAGEVRVSARELDGDRVAFVVSDTGIGIHADDQERIFDSFERVDDAPSADRGGLGLPLARRLARQLGGDVTVRSVPGEGSVFSAVLARRLHDHDAFPRLG